MSKKSGLITLIVVVLVVLNPGIFCKAESVGCEVWLKALIDN